MLFSVGVKLGVLHWDWRCCGLDTI